MNSHDEDNLVIQRNGKGVKLNSRLVDRQGVWDNVPKIKILHHAVLMVTEIMDKSSDPKVLRTCDAFYDLLEYKLQEQWGFPHDSNFFRFWKRPKCSCPSMDNEDRYPHGSYIISADCIVHD